jgi:transcription elongation factor Elf1
MINIAKDFELEGRNVVQNMKFEPEEGFFLVSSQQSIEEEQFEIIEDFHQNIEDKEENSLGDFKEQRQNFDQNLKQFQKYCRSFRGRFDGSIEIFDSSQDDVEKPGGIHQNYQENFKQSIVNRGKIRESVEGTQKISKQPKNFIKTTQTMIEDSSQSLEILQNPSPAQNKLSKTIQKSKGKTQKSSQKPCGNGKELSKPKQKCLICGKKFFRLKRHISTHFGNFECDICGEAFTSFHLIFNHIQWHSLRKPSLTQQTSKIRCLECATDFTKIILLEQHLLKVHTKIGVFKCNKCDFTTATYRSLFTHKATHQKSEKPLICLKCFQEFSNLFEFNEHKKIHLFACGICDERFHHESQKLNHIAENHGEFERRFIELIFEGLKRV